MFGLRSHAIFFIALIAMASPALAQFETAAVLGSVSDPNNAAVTGAHVELRNLDTGVVQSGATDSGGAYQFLDVHPGRYQIAASASDSRTPRATSFALIPPRGSVSTSVSASATPLRAWT
jgi:protocatechuate 3,4-dioxygenase beta subunit